MGVLSDTTKSFDSKVAITAPSGKHSDPKTAKDLKRITTQLLECAIFNPQTQDIHSSFPHLKKKLIRTLEEQQLKDWMAERFSNLLQPDLSPHDISNISNDSNN